MAKWYINFDGNQLATAFPDQASLEAVGVADGIYEDGFAVIITDPDDPDDDWTTYVNNMFAIPQGVLNLVSNLLPDPGVNQWGAIYAWELNGGA